MFWNDVGGVVDFMCAGMIQDGADSVCMGGVADSVCWMSCRFSVSYGKSCRFCVLEEL